MEIKVTMPLTKTELLIPRVLCIGGKEGEPNYPGSQFNTGDIVPLFLTDAKGEKYCWLRKEVFLYESDLDKFPNCFKPLPWWYGRTVEEMPEYISHTLAGLPTLYFKILNWRMENKFWLWEGENDFKGSFVLWKPECQYQPADESDYQEYQKQKEAK